MFLGDLISILAKPFISALPYIGGILTPVNLPCAKGGLIFKVLNSWYLKLYKLILYFSSINYDSLNSIYNL